jgi:CRISPR/Cas system endoribonuclease Cas6 (RAMP superfamily)
MNISLVGYDAGLGARNSMGFGLVEKIRALKSS